MSKISELRYILERQKGERNQILVNIRKAKNAIIQLQKELELYTEAQNIVRVVGLRTQQELQLHISGLVSMALNAIFDDPYQLQVDFVQRRNKTECDLSLVKDGLVAHPLTATGGGVVDIVSFALRAVAWTMNTPRTAPVFILDEPFHNLSVDLMHRASTMLKQMSEQLGIQMIIVTHEEELEYAADKVFYVSKQNNKSIVL